jgi:hypothetical protein
MVALGLLASAAVSLAALASVAVRTNALARERTLSALYASQKMEELSRAAATLPVTPADALARDAPGAVEFLDAGGRAATAASGVVFVRRWSVATLAQDANLLAIIVEVSPCRGRVTGSPCQDPSARIRLSTIRSRLVW